MWAEWLKFLRLKKKRRKSPADAFKYLISESVIRNTQLVLKQYAAIDSGHEGFVYWAGFREGDVIHINTVIAPETISSEGRVSVPALSNFYVVQCLSAAKLTQLAQVHSHPGTWVGHSSGDDSHAAFKREGLLSVVVPKYGTENFSLKQCGIHRFQGGEFLQLSRRYVKEHVRITTLAGKLFDLRNKDDIRWKHQNGIN